jgi:hypothetical protein
VRELNTQKPAIHKSYPTFLITTTNMPTKGELIEEAVIKASQAMDADPKLTGTAATAKFQAPYHRLMARRRGRLVSNTRGGHNKKLAAP